MFSRIVPWNSHVSWRTIPNVERSSSRDISRLSMPSMRMPPVVDLVEAHQQVDQGRLAGAGRPDDGHRLAGLDDEVELLDERHVGQIAERDVLEARPRPATARRTAGERRRRATSSASSSSSNTRSAEAMADWMTLAMLAVWVIGIVNWREYWTKACTSPRLIWPFGDLDAADDADGDVVDVGDELHHRLDRAGQELRSIAGLVEPLVLLVELVDRLAAAGRTP